MATKHEKVEQVEIFGFVERIDSHNHNGEGEIVIHFMVRETHDGRTQFYNVSDTTYDLRQYGGLYLHDLKVRAYIEKDDSGDVKPISAYWAKPQYRDVWRVELDAAEAMAHTLRTIANRIKKYHEEWGSPQTFEQACLYVLKAVGVKRIVRLNTMRMREMSGEEFYITSVAEVSSLIYGLLHPPIIVTIAEAPPIVPQAISEA